MKKRVKSLLLCAATALTVGAFATACEEELPHVHTYSEEWTADAEGHFHQATCDDAEDEAKQPHVDKNNDGACDICEYTDHTHTYSEDWTVDCTNHWHAADCGHTVAGADVEAHVDENEDGECDVCKYVIEDIHEHYFDSKWTSDESYHWHAALCEHKGEIDGKAAHELNAAGDCTVCGEHIQDVAMTDIGAVLNAAVANNYKIIDGSVVFDNKVYGGTGAQTLQTGLTNEVYFVLGNGESYINMKSFDKTGAFIGVVEQWHQKVSDEEYFGIVLEDVSINPTRELAPASSGAKFLNGYNYLPGSVVPGEEVDTSTLSAMLTALYSQMKAGERVSNATEGYDEATGKYTFAYTYYSVNVTTSGGVFYSIELELYNVTVAFTVNEDMIIDWAEFEVEVYRNYENDSDLDYTYEIGADGATATLTSDVTLKDTANPTYYRYNVAQRSGERTFTSPYPRESLLPKDFELYYVAKYHDDDYNFNVVSETKVEDTLTLRETQYVSYFDEDGEPCPERVVQSSKYVRLHLGNAMPITASCSFINQEDLEITYVNKTEGATGELWTMDSTYNKMTNCIAFYPKNAGTYELTIKYKEVVKTITVIVPDDIGSGEDVGGGDDEGDEDEGTYDYNTVITVDNGSVWFSADEISANGATRKLTIAEDGKYKISNSDLHFASVTDANNTVIAPVNGIYTLTAGEYTVAFDMFAILSVKKNTEYVISVVKQADEPVTPPAEEGTDISGTYLTSNGQLVIDSKAGTIVYTFKTYTFNYTYTIADNVVSLYKDGSPVASNLMGGLDLDENGKPATWYYNGNSYALTKASDSEGGEGGETPDEATAVTDVQIIAGVNNLTLAENTYIEVSAQGFAGSYTVTWDVQNVTVEINGEVYTSGDIFTSTSPMLSNAFKIYGANYAAVDALVLTFTEYVAPAPVLVVGSNTVASSSQGVEVTFTASEAGTYTFTVGENGVLGYDYENKFAGEYYELELEANETVEFFVGTEDYTEDDILITIALSESTGGGEEGGDEPIETEEPAGVIYEDTDNEITVTADDITKGYVLYTFMPWSTGEYYLFSMDLYIECLIDGEGNQITTNDNGYFEVEEYTQYIVKMGVSWLSAGTYVVNAEYQYPLGSQENPIGLWEAGEHTANWQGGWMPIWHTYTVGEDGVLTISTTNANATISLSLKAGYEIESVEGTVSLNVIAGTTYNIGVAGGMDAEEIEFTVAFEAGAYEGNGTANAPTVMVAGDNEITVGDSAPYFMYKATEEGVLTLTAGENCAYNVIYPEYMEPVEGVLTVIMGADQFIIVCVNTAAYEPGTATLNVVWNAVTANTEATITEGDNELTLNQYEYISVEAQGFEGDYTVTWDNENVIVEIYGEQIENGYTLTSWYPSYPWGFKVYANGYAAANVTLTIAKVVVPTTPVELGTNTVTVTDTWNGTSVSFTATEAGTYTFTAGTNAVLGYDYSNYLAGEFFSVELEEGESVEFVVLTEDYAEGDVVVTVTKEAEGGEEDPETPATPDGTQAKPYVVESLPYTYVLEGSEVWVTYTATEDCLITLARTGGSFNNVPGGFVSDVPTKTSTGSLTKGETLTFCFYKTSSAAQTLTISIAEFGSVGNPYPIDTLPFEYKVTGAHNFWATYTATEACTLVFGYTAGSDANGIPTNFVKDEAACTYTGTVTAGQVIKINPYATSAEAVEYTYKITVKVEEETPDEGGEGETSDAVTYLASHSGGRKYKVIIAGDSITVIRSDLTGNFPEGGTTTNEGTITGDEVTLTNCKVTLAEGVPVSLTWGTQTVTDFTKQ